MDKHDLEQAVLSLVNQRGYQPLKPRRLAEALRLGDDQVKDVTKQIKKLVKRGKLAFGPEHLVLPVSAARSDCVTGTFRRTAKGFGFVRPLPPVPAWLQQQDVYVAARHAADASTGDTVVVRLRKRAAPDRDKFEGAIQEILERDTHEFVGTYFERAGGGYVQVDGTVFSQPIFVGDPGAKNARPEDKVVFEMVRFPSHMHDGEGVIVEVLGQRGEPGVDTRSIIREFHLPGEFAADALSQARREAEEFDESIAPGRADLTAEVVITIDPVDARDFDDAISLVELEGGHWRLGVHIADVAHFVVAATALDREAHARATSVYLPDRVIPMLPEVISNGLASLQPGRLRYTKTAFIELTADGAHVATDLVSAAIRSSRRFTYEEVDDYLANRDEWRTKLSPEVFALLERMHRLAMILRARRARRGALELSLREVKVDLGPDGRVVGAHRVAHTESHQIIEEFMLAANEAVAEWLKGAKIPFLRRVHAPPDPRKLKALAEFARDLGHETDGLESRFELQRLLAAVEGRPEQQALNYALLRSLQRAVYSPAEEGHYALASDCYCHFTSPIRRYPDLSVHRLVEACLNHRRPEAHFAELAALGEHCSEREQRAEAAERELTKIKLLGYLSERLGMEMEAVVTGVEEFGLFVQGVELPAEGLVHVSSLLDDYYQLDRVAHTLAGRRAGNAFRLGDPLRVAVVRVDVDRRELDFRVVVREKRPTVSTAYQTPATRKATRLPDERATKNKKLGHGKKKSAAGRPKRHK